MRIDQTFASWADRHGEVDRTLTSETVPLGSLRDNPKDDDLSAQHRGLEMPIGRRSICRSEAAIALTLLGRRTLSA